MIMESQEFRFYKHKKSEQFLNVIALYANKASYNASLIIKYLCTSN